MIDNNYKNYRNYINNKEKREDRIDCGDKNERSDRGDTQDGRVRLESLLATLGRSAPPEGLKERLLRSVEERRLRERVVTPRVLKIVAASLAFGALFWGADFLTTRAEKKRLAALFDLNMFSQVQKDTESFLMENQALTESERLFFFSTGFRYQRPKKGGQKTQVYLKLSDLEEELNGT